MTTLADRTIAALRAEHDALAAVVGGLDDAQLTGPSGAADWTVADVLSHLGSGAEIALAGVEAGLGGEAPADGFNQSVWDRWNALTPRGQADGFLAGDAALVARFEGLDADQRTNLSFPVGFLPAPLPVAAYAGLRLDEQALHAWDVRVAVDPAATIVDQTALILLEHFAGDISFLLGFIGKADAVSERVALDLGGSGFGLVIDETVSLTTDPADSTAVFSGGPGSAMQLLSGRLRPEYTPAELTVTGNTDLDTLRAVLPGF